MKHRALDTFADAGCCRPFDKTSGYLSDHNGKAPWDLSGPRRFFLLVYVRLQL